MTVSNMRTILTGMSSGGHSTRTILIPKNNPELLVVSRGSNENLDYGALDIRNGRSQIRVFNMSEAETFEFNSKGHILGCGLRNSVGIGEDNLGRIWAIENSADNVERDNRDIHQRNPAEELNFLGYPNATTRNFGYPSCFAVGDISSFLDNTSLQLGDQFVFSPNATLNDTTCATDFTSPRLSFTAHMAPWISNF